MTKLLQVVLDCVDTRGLAEFYRQLLGWQYRRGDETADPAGDDWLVIVSPQSGQRIAFQRVDELQPPSWPSGGPPQQLHLDLTVGSREELDADHDRATSLGARLLSDRSDDPEEPLRVYADPAGHPFCIFISPYHEAAPG